ncbi:MAG: hypothetical protein IT574_10390 [Candidatus Aureabacteria bacterium]|nr:hypothetical protein [Candidatus Auribacterota bacterium]NLW94989.1 hypothetical protein [Chlamydiota bacterium]HOE26980.1 hypothetical protein [bacterium]
MLPRELLTVLEETGPQTGWRLMKRTRLDALPLWQLVRRTPGVQIETAGTRFLRLDRGVEGYARLSPSIRREFLTYTVLGAEGRRDAVAARAELLREEIREISRSKFDLARETMATAVQSLPRPDAVKDRVCFIIAGDIVYEMAHAVPRPERSTGRMVRGSDLDIVAVADDATPPEILRALDEAILERKQYLLFHPRYREEIDYVVKNLSRVQTQLAFDSFRKMIAAKILHEGRLLYGSEEVFETVKGMVAASGVPDRLRLLERRALERRVAAEAALLRADPARRDGECFDLFHTADEGDEIY